MNKSYIVRLMPKKTTLEIIPDMKPAFILIGEGVSREVFTAYVKDTLFDEYDLRTTRVMMEMPYVQANKIHLLDLED